MKHIIGKSCWKILNITRREIAHTGTNNWAQTSETTELVINKIRDSRRFGIFQDDSKFAMLQSLDAGGSCRRAGAGVDGNFPADLRGQLHAVVRGVGKQVSQVDGSERDQVEMVFSA